MGSHLVLIHWYDSQTNAHLLSPLKKGQHRFQFGAKPHSHTVTYDKVFYHEYSPLADGYTC